MGRQLINIKIHSNRILQSVNDTFNPNPFRETFTGPTGTVATVTASATNTFTTNNTNNGFPNDNTNGYNDTFTAALTPPD